MADKKRIGKYVCAVSAGWLAACAYLALGRPENSPAAMELNRLESTVYQTQQAIATAQQSVDVDVHVGSDFPNQRSLYIDSLVTGLAHQQEELDFFTNSLAYKTMEHNRQSLNINLGVLMAMGTLGIAVGAVWTVLPHKRYEASGGF